MSILVNNVEIREEEVNQEMQHYPAPTKEQAWQLAAQSLVIRQLLLQKAAEYDLIQDAGAITANELEERAIDLLLQRDVVVPEADQATCQRFYDTHPDSFVNEDTGERQSIDQVQAQIRDYLHTKAMRIAVSEYIRALSHNADIRGFELGK